MLLHKIIKYAALAIALVAGVFFIYILSVGDTAIQSDTTGEFQNSTIVPLIYLTYIILAFIVLLVLVFVFKNLFSSPAVLKKSLISVGLLAVVCVIAYVIAGDGLTNPINQKPYMLGDGEALSASGSKLIGASIYAFYILAIAAVAAILWSGISKLLNR